MEEKDRKQSQESPVWEKVLWRQQSFPDNYVPPSFLSSLRRNANVQPYTYKPLIIAASPITQHASILFIFISTFIHLRNGKLDPRLLIWASVGSFLLGYIAWEIMHRVHRSPMNFKAQRLKAIKSSILVFLALVAVTPVLKTLTEATASDSIWALSASLFTLNTMLADYGGAEPGAHHLTSVLSMNAAISASVVLASRLASNTAVFALVLLAVVLFALFPIMRKLLQRSPTVIRVAITASLAGLSVVLWMSISEGIAALICSILVFINFVAPAILVWSQKHKNEIRGSWDPAVPQVRVTD